MCPEAPPLPSSTTPSEETVRTVVSEEDEVTPGTLAEAGSLSLVATETARPAARPSPSWRRRRQGAAWGSTGQGPPPVSR